MTNSHPHLRSHTRRRKSGKVTTYYVYDRRPEKDIALGSDYDKALAKWAEIYHQTDTVAGTLEEVFRLWEAVALPAYTSAETRRGYTKNLRKLRTGFAEATWDAIGVPTLKGYLDKRAGKTQANREISLLSVIWHWARLKGYTDVPWPATDMKRSRWKNTEQPRRFRPTEELFALVFEQGDQMLRDCMNLAAATGMRLTDCRTILLPRSDLLRLEASKTGKEADFDLSLSQVLPELVARRRAMKVDHLMLLSTPRGKPVSPTMLRDRWDRARLEAAIKAKIANDDDLARQLEAMWLRDMRKLASRRAGGGKASADLLQHADQRLTDKHYPGAVPVLRPVK